MGRSPYFHGLYKENILQGFLPNEEVVLGARAEGSDVGTRGPIGPLWCYHLERVETFPRASLVHLGESWHLPLHGFLALPFTFQHTPSLLV